MDCGEYLLKKTNSLQRTERREIATDCNFTTAIGSLHSLIDNCDGFYVVCQATGNETVACFEESFAIKETY